MEIFMVSLDVVDRGIDSPVIEHDFGVVHISRYSPYAHEESILS
jgi:hypothetical protein